jgi:hypothetical protein
MVIALDFAEIPSDSIFESRSIFVTLPKDLEARLSALPQVLERVQGAVMFAEQSTKQSDPVRSAAYLRAALADFCSIEEMQAIDRPSSTPLRLAAMKNPLLHLLELMRHLNIHVKAVQAAPRTVDATLGEHTFSLETYVVSNLDANDLAALRNGKRYALPDLQKMVAWFNESQNYWGSGYVVRVGVEAFAQALCTHHNL